MTKRFLAYWQTKFRLLLFMSFIIGSSAIAQNKYTLTGKVTSVSLADSPLPGVNIKIIGTDKGVVTDFDGIYSIEVEDGNVLEFSSVGFKNKTVVISGQKTQDVALEDDLQTLEEVVVVGYGTQKRKNITSAISKISGEAVKDRAVARIDNAIVGRVSGVQIQATNPEAGGAPRIVVRGQGSIQNNSAPLIVVDGIPLGTDPDLLGSIDSSNVESIDILKDASSVAIYGSRGANGVIIVTLKEGKAGPTKYSFNTYTGHQFVPHNDDYTGNIASQQARIDRAQAALDASDNPNKDIIQADIHDANSRLAAGRIIAEANGGETDWQDVVIPGGTITNYSFAARGGSERTSFNASLGYTHDQGVLLVDDFKKYNAGLKLSSKSKNKRVKVYLNLNAEITKQRRFGGRINQRLRQSSWLPTRLNQNTIGLINRNAKAGGNSENRTGLLGEDLQVGDFPFERLFDDVFEADGEGGLVRNPDGTVSVSNDGSNNLNLNTTGDNNAFSSIISQRDLRNQNKFRGSTYVEFKLLDGLKFKQSLFGDYRVVRDNLIRGLDFDEKVINGTRRRDRYRTNEHYGTESFLTYKKNIGAHDFDAIVGFTFENWDYTLSDIDKSTGFDTDETRNIPQSQAAPAFTEIGSEKLVSYLGRLNYAYDDRYLASVSLRQDGSSRFGSNTKFGFFPAASVGWVASNESFLQDVDAISNLKLRASYGVSGSNNLVNDLFDSLFRSVGTFNAVSFDGNPNGLKNVIIENPNLQWERLIETNLGLDLDLYNGKFGVTLDLYKRTSDKLILNLRTPSVTGSDFFLQNIGEVENKGAEIELRSQIFNTKNFSWNVSGQFTKNINKLTDFAGNDGLESEINDTKRNSGFIANEGQPITTFFGFVKDREIPNEFIKNPFYPINGRPADVYVKDLNGDGLIDNEDKTELGNPYPDFEWGFTSDFKVYDFDISFSLQGSHGGEVITSDLNYQNLEFAGNNQLETPQNLIDAGEDIPGRDLGFIQKRFLTDDYVRDASFVTLRNISIGYTLPNSVTEKLKINKARFYFSGDNLLYFTADEYFGFNPEGRNYTSRNSNTPLTFGYQRGEKPIARVLSIGLNLDF